MTFSVGSTYTAPEDGWFNIAATADAEVTLERGTVLAYIVASDSCEVLGADSTADKYASYILAEDVTTSKTEVVVAQAYQTGKFIENALVVAESYTLAAADIKSLRDGGIYLV